MPGKDRGAAGLNPTDESQAARHAVKQRAEGVGFQMKARFKKVLLGILWQFSLGPTDDQSADGERIGVHLANIWDIDVTRAFRWPR